MQITLCIIILLFHLCFVVLMIALWNFTLVIYTECIPIVSLEPNHLVYYYFIISSLFRGANGSFVEFYTGYLY